MNKAYNKITWQNKPSTATPLNQTNLNEMSNALDTIDDRVIALDNDKVSKEEGKGLSSNDYTTAEKMKLAGIATGATAVSISDTLQDGDTIANITIDGTTTAIKAKQPNESEMNVRSAMLLLSTTPIGENAPFVKRRSGGSVPFPALLKDKIIGASVVWNQLVKNGNFADTSNWSAQRVTFSVSNNVGSVTLTDTSDPYIDQQFASLANHKYLYCAEVKRANSNANVRAVAYYNGTSNNKTYTTTTDNWEQACLIVDNTTASNNRIRITEVGTKTVGDTFQVKNAMVFDLTSMFGSTIADYVYTLETQTAGSGIAWLKSYGFFTEDYYAYSANTIQSVSVSAKTNSNSHNIWNEQWATGTINATTGMTEYDPNRVRSKDYIMVRPNTSYYSLPNMQIFGYGINKNYIGVVSSSTAGATFTTPNNCYYIMFRTPNAYGGTYHNDLGINYPNNITSYEPYTETTYSLDHTTLRGLFKLDANNNLYADGDIYPSGGTESVKYGEVDLGSIPENAWTYYTAGDNPIFYTSISDSATYTSGVMPDSITENYIGISSQTRTALTSSLNNMECSFIKDTTNFVLRNDSCTSVSALVSALSGKTLVYKKLTPTTASLTSYQSLQNIENGGTEEFIDYGVEQETRDVAIPVGGERQYYQGMDLPALPTASGNHNLQFNPSSGFSWS